MKRLRIIIPLLFAVTTAICGERMYVQTGEVDLTKTVTLDFYLDGRETFPHLVSSKDGVWSIWIKNLVTMNAPDLDITAYPLDYLGAASTNESTVIVAAADLSDSTDVFCYSLSTQVACSGFRFVIADGASSNTGSATAIFYYTR